MAREKTRELEFNRNPFTFVGGEEFTVADLMPEVDDDEAAAKPRHSSSLDYPLYDQTIEEAYVEPKKGNKGKGPADMMDYVSCRENEIDIEEVPDPVSVRLGQTVRFVIMKNVKRYRRLLKRTIESAKRRELPDGRVILVLKHA